MHSAENRTESRRAHAHEDYPDQNDDDWMDHTLAYYDEKEGKTKIAYRTIHYYTLDEEECKTVPPVARVLLRERLWFLLWIEIILDNDSV